MRLIKKLFLLLFLWSIHFTMVAQRYEVTILHTNDTHSQVESFNDKKWGNVGGVLRRNELILREKEIDPNLLLLDAGDYFQGTPYFNLFGGEVEIELMNRLNYDVVTLGNHEFDNGVRALWEKLKKANFDIVCANYRFKFKPIRSLVKPYVILERNGAKIGVFGLSPDLQGLSSPEVINGIKFLDPVETAQKMVDILKENNCDLIICLSHLGYSTDKPTQEVSDMILAESVNGIDLIVGGHTHTYLPEMQIINDTRIVQAKNKGTFVGKIVISN